MTRRRALAVALHTLWIGTLAWLGARTLAGVGGGVRRVFRKVRLGTLDRIVAANGSIVAVEGRTYFVTIERGSPIALDMQCTHGACTVRYDTESDRFVCPCHGGIFRRDGSVVQGPPQQPLARVPVRVEGDQLYLLDSSS